MAPAVPAPPVDPLLAAAPAVTAAASALLGPLVDVSSPSGDHDGYERCVELVTGALPEGAEVERLACSTDGFPPDLLVRLEGTGRARLVLLGHLDTVVAHGEHRPFVVDGHRWDGSGTFDMKGGDALAVGVLGALAAPAVRERYAEVALLLVSDEEWRSAPFAHGARFADWDACLCFEGGERTATGDEAVVVRRKAASTIHVAAIGRAAHAGSRPDDGRNALVALARGAVHLAARHDPRGPEALSVVPTILRSGGALNVVPDAGELVCDLRADDLASVERVLATIPAQLDGVALESWLGRRWPGMDHRTVAAPVLRRAGSLLGRAIVPAARGGASDASHLAQHVRVAIDGLGPLGGGAHAVDEHVDGRSLGERAEVALAVAAALLDRDASREGS